MLRHRRPARSDCRHLALARRWIPLSVVVGFLCHCRRLACHCRRLARLHPQPEGGTGGSDSSASPLPRLQTQVTSGCTLKQSYHPFTSSQPLSLPQVCTMGVPSSHHTTAFAVVHSPSVVISPQSVSDGATPRSVDPLVSAQRIGSPSGYLTLLTLFSAPTHGLLIDADTVFRHITAAHRKAWPSLPRGRPGRWSM